MHIILQLKMHTIYYTLTLDLKIEYKFLHILLLLELKEVFHTFLYKIIFKKKLSFVTQVYFISI